LATRGPIKSKKRKLTLVTGARLENSLNNNVSTTDKRSFEAKIKGNRAKSPLN